MENKEQLIEALNKIVENAGKPVFTEEEYDTFRQAGLSEEEIKELEKMEMLSDTIDVLPSDKKDMDRLGAVLEVLSSGDGKQNLEKLRILAEKDPKVFAQVMALTSVIENEVLAEDK